MPVLRLKLSALLESAGLSPAPGAPDMETLTTLVQRQFAFLPQPLTITVEGDEVVLQFPEESAAARAEAARLAQRGGKRAAEGDYAKAIELLQRALKLQPSLHSARRDLAMACMESGDADTATDHLIEVLRLDPSDAWAWVVLGNLYTGPKNDLETGEKFLRKALALQPGDAWALNSLAVLHQKRGAHAEAIRLFEESIAANPELPNPYCGVALSHETLHQPGEAAAVLQRLFRSVKRDDQRRRGAWDQARGLYVRVQQDMARRDESAAFKCVQDYKAQVESLSGYPVKEEEQEFKDTTGAIMQMAWKHGRDHHRLVTRRGYAPELLSHVRAHELTHLKMEAEARAAGANRFFLTTPATREAARRDLAADADKLRRAGYAPDAVAQLHDKLVSGLCSFLYNCPLDMLIERQLHHHFPQLRPAQFLSLRLMAAEALRASIHPEIAKVTPRRIARAAAALNGAYGLFLDDLYDGAGDFAAPWRRMENFDMAARLYDHWQAASASIKLGGGGYEYVLVDQFADLLGLRAWYDWKPDPGPHEVVASGPVEGVTNEALLKEKHPAAVWHLLNALNRYAQLSDERIREITFDAGFLGQRGLNYDDPVPRHTLKSLPGETLTGLQVICLLYAGFKRLNPAAELQLDLNEPFLTALELFQKGGRE